MLDDVASSVTQYLPSAATGGSGTSRRDASSPQAQPHVRAVATRCLAKEIRMTRPDTASPPLQLISIVTATVLRYPNGSQARRESGASLYSYMRQHVSLPFQVNHNLIPLRCLLSWDRRFRRYEETPSLLLRLALVFTLRHKFELQKEMRDRLALIPAVLP